MKSFLQLCLTIVSGIAFVYIGLEVIKDPEKVATLTLSIYAHELGHLVVFALYGVHSYIVMLPLLGGVTIPENMDRLKHGALAAVVMAGPVVNATIGGYALYKLGTEFDRSWISVASLNLLLCAWNLVPIAGITDGGKLLRTVMASLDERGDQIVSFIGIVIMLLFSAVLIVHEKSVILFSFAVLIGVVRDSFTDDPAASTSTHAMGRATAFFVFLTWVGLMLTTFIATLYLPSWLA